MSSVAIVGAGVVGLAVARQLARQGREVVVLEAAGSIGTKTSSRNSEVVHAGIYYDPGSLKAKLCVEGRHELVAYCQSRGVEVKNIGKLIVATNADQVPQLENIAARGLSNKVDDLGFLRSSADVQAIEPEVRGVAGLFSPSTGVIDSHSFMLALQSDALDHGAVFAFNTRLVEGACKCSHGGGSGEGSEGWLLKSCDTSTGELFDFRVDSVVNAAGLESAQVAAALGCPLETVPQMLYAKGNYFKLARSSAKPFSHLVYPIPEVGGLGVHATIDLGGEVRFGPDVEWVESYQDLKVDPRRTQSFYAAIRSYWPGIDREELAPDYCGIRPKLAMAAVGNNNSSQPADFAIHGSSFHGQQGLVSLHGIESPGLTSSMAIARVVSDMVGAENHRKIKPLS